MQGLNSSVITAHEVLNVQGPLGNRDGEQDNETCSARRLSTSGRRLFILLKSSFFNRHKISMTITYYNKSKHGQSIQLTRKSPY